MTLSITAARFRYLSLCLLCRSLVHAWFGESLIGYVLPSASDEIQRSSPTDNILHTVPLRKQYVPVKKNGETIAYKTAYFGKVFAGTPEPQAFTVVFDTGSGHLILPSTSCSSEACQKHNLYNRSRSDSALDIEYDGTPIPDTAQERDQLSISFGTGEVKGEFVREVACLSPSAVWPMSSDCVQLRTVLATRMTSDPFSLFDFDGVIGIGLKSLALNEKFSFLGQMVAQHPARLPQFSVFLAMNDAEQSSISFGGHEKRHALTEVKWAPVALDELGYWQVWLKSVRMGDQVLEDCADGQCRAILDTGTSLLGVPRQAARSLHRHLARPVPKDLDSVHHSEIDCRSIPGKQLHFDVGDTLVSLGVEEYSRPQPFNITVPGKDGGQLFCRSLLMPVDMAPPLGPKVFIWGEPVLRKYLTIYDFAQKRVGFSVANQQSSRSEGNGDAPPRPDKPPAGSLVPGAPLRVPAPSMPVNQQILRNGSGSAASNASDSVVAL